MPGQLGHPLCDPSDEEWWPADERALYVAAARPGGGTDDGMGAPDGRVDG